MRSSERGALPGAREATAADLLRASVVTVRHDETIRDAARRMFENEVGAVPVLSESGAPIGMVSDGDLLGLRQGHLRRDWRLDLVAKGGADVAPPPFAGDRPVREVMSAPLVTVALQTPAAKIAELMRLNRVKRLPVVEDGELVGIVSRADVIGLVETLKPAAKNAGAGLLEFLEGLIGGASLRGLPQTRTTPTPERHAAPALAFTAATLRAEAQKFDAKREESVEAEHAAIHMKRQSELKEMLQAHVSEALWRNLMNSAEVAAQRGETEVQLLQFPCGLCVDGGRSIDVHEEGWATTLRGEPAEIFTRWRDELQPQGFHLDARMVRWDEQGILGDAGLFLQWGAKASGPQAG